jgi:CubicO group peptidase (beta-lactamase class C family)
MAAAMEDMRLERPYHLLQRWISEGAFPGAAAAITVGGEPAALMAAGRFTYEQDSPAVSTGTIFDLASVTKVVATTAMAMLLYERGELDLDTPLAAFLPGFAGKDSRRNEVTVRMLLGHSSGLPGYERLFERAGTREELLREALCLPLTAAPGTRIEYSDIGFILLGEVLEQVAGESLERYCRREVFGPLGMADTCFHPPWERRSAIPPTENDREFRRSVVQGVVHDENAWVMGGVAGHAGLFASAGDVAKFAQAVLAGSLVRAETLRCFTQAVELEGKRHALGWDVPTPPSQAGRHLSPRSFGHLGFTGTSLWIDPERALTVTLLSNRTWPDRSSETIKSARPEFHDAVVESLFPETAG